jgi:tyrosyl-tRNA synthetase
VTYLKYFTFLTRDEIEALEAEVRTAPEKRVAQRTLARAVTATIHGQDAVDRAEHASGLLFGERISELDVDDIIAVFDDVPSTDMGRESFGEGGVAIADLLVKAGLASSKGDAMRLVKGGGVYVNNRRVGDERARFTPDQAIEGRVFVMRKGARQYHLVRIV